MTARGARIDLARQWLASEAWREEWRDVPEVNRVMFAESLRARWQRGEWQIEGGRP